LRILSCYKTSRYAFKHNEVLNLLKTNGDII